MSIRHLLYIAAMCFAAFTARPGKIAAQPTRPVGDNEYGGYPGMHLFLQSNFLSGIQEDRLLFARSRFFSESYRKAIEQGDYQLALHFTDSLIKASESHRIPGVRFVGTYKQRAQLLKALGRTKEACVAYDDALRMQDSLMRLVQSETIREMQASYELDRLALDRAILKAHHHKVMLNSLWLLLLVVVVGILFIYIANRRSKRLQRELLLQMHHSTQSEEKKIAFINSMCHEVRTPLNCVSGFSELLCANDTEPEAHAQYCEIIRDNCRQLRYIFDDIIEVAFLESLHDPLPRDYMDLSALCRTQIHAMKVKYPKQGLNYTSAIPVEEIGLNCNPKYLAMLVSTLLSNAYKFTQKGFVHLECGHVGDDEVFIAIADTGCGVPPEQQERVFERFIKLDTFSQGNGLGLHLCRLIARHLGGNVKIDPDYTGGTRFVVTLPRK